MKNSSFLAGLWLLGLVPICCDSYKDSFKVGLSLLLGDLVQLLLFPEGLFHWRWLSNIPKPGHDWTQISTPLEKLEWFA